MGLGMPIPDLSNKPGPGRPGYGPTGNPYAFQFEVSAGQVGITVLPNINGIGFTIEWQDGTTQAITSGQTNLQSPTTQAGIISINKETDTGFCDHFAVIDGKEFVTKVISWGQNPWNTMNSAFLNCTNLTDVGVTSLKTDGILGYFDFLFKGCSSLTAIDMTNWDLSSGAGASIRSIAQDCVNLEQVDIPSNKKIKFRTQSDSLFRNVGTSTTNGCIFNMQGLDSSDTTVTSGYANSSWFYDSKMSPSSNFSNWVFNSSLAFNVSQFFRNAEMTGTNSTLDISGWSSLKATSFSSFLRGFNSNGLSPKPDSNFTINLSNLNLSHATYLGYFMGSSNERVNVRNIIGLSTLPAMVAAATSTTNFISGCSFLKLTAADNFSDAFMNSLNSTDANSMLNGLGRDLAFGDHGKAPNLASLNLSASTSIAGFIRDTKFSDAPDFSNVIFPTAAVSATSFAFGMDISDTNAHLIIDRPTFKPLSLSNAFRSLFCSKITIGDSVDLSSCTTFQNLFVYAGSVSRPLEVTLPTTADYSGITTTAALNNLVNQLNGPLGGTQVLSTCVGDTLIRRLFATTLNNNPQLLNLYSTKTTGSPSVVSSHITDLTAAGWTITDNTTDAVMPFVYTTPINVNTPTTPTGSFTGGTFSSSDPTNIPVNATTGEIDTGNSGDTTIRYTLADGCYNEQAVSLVAFPLKLKHNVTSGVEKTITIDRIAKNADPVTVDWGDGQTEQLTYNGNGAVSHTYNSGNVGTTENPIASFGDADDTGRITGIYYNTSGDDVDLLSIEQWGISSASYTYYHFGKCRSLQLNATDKPDLAQSSISFASMFSGCTAFTGNESMKDWNTSNVTAMVSMFRDCPNFNVSALNWDVSNVTNFTIMFYNVGGATTSGSFNGRLDNWDFSSSNNISNFMHGQRSFNNDSVKSWNVSTITSFSTTLTSCSSFNQDLNNWDVSSAVNLASLFYGCTAMNGNISNWDTRNVTNMSGTFRLSGFNTSNAGFNTNANNIYWNTSNVTNMSLCFYQKNGQITSISDWDTSSVQSFSNFAGATINFNPDIESWDVSSCANFSAMINSTGAGGFNKDLSSWDVSSGTNFSNGLANTEVNFDLSSWVLTDAVAVYRLFLNVAEFNQNASSMVLGVNITRLDFIFYLSGIDAINFTDTIVGWAVQVSTNSAPYNVNALSLTAGVNLISTRTSDNASGQTYAAKYGSDWTATGWTDAGDALNFLTTATASGGAGWSYST